MGQVFVYEEDSISPFYIHAQGFQVTCSKWQPVEGKQRLETPSLLDRKSELPCHGVHLENLSYTTSPSGFSSYDTKKNEELDIKLIGCETLSQWITFLAFNFLIYKIRVITWLTSPTELRPEVKFKWDNVALLWKMPCHKIMADGWIPQKYENAPKGKDYCRGYWRSELNGDLGFRWGWWGWFPLWSEVGSVLKEASPMLWEREEKRKEETVA